MERTHVHPPLGDEPVGVLGALRSYLGNIVRAVATTFEGLTVTSSWLFRRPMTLQYPDKLEKPVQELLPELYRGLLEVDLDRCIACGLCARACPLGCIAFKAEKNAESGGRDIVQFDIDMGRCMYCGLCSEACRSEAIHHTTDFEGAVESPESLILRYVTQPVPASRAKAGQEPPAKPVGSILAQVAPACFARKRWQGTPASATATATATPTAESGTGTGEALTTPAEPPKEGA